MKIATNKPAETAIRTLGMRGFSLLELVIVIAVLSIILVLMGGIITSVVKAYEQERPRTEAVSGAAAAMDTMVRLVRMSGNNLAGTGITPGTVSNGATSTIRIQSDWNPVDGALTGTFEDVTFSASGGVMYKQEPSDNSAVAFLPNIGSLTFTYYDTSDNQIMDPVTNNSQISQVKIVLTTQTTGLPAMTFTSIAHIRKN